MLLNAIDFEGNQAFSDAELRETLRLHALPAVYMQDRLEYDVTVNLISHYWNSGYILARAGAPRLELKQSKDRPFQSVTIPIEEGPHFRYGRLRLQGFRLVEVPKLLQRFGLVEGDPVNLSALRRATDELTRIYHRQGYIDFETAPRVEPNVKERTVDIMIEAREGVRYLVGKIEVPGLEREHDKAVRSALQVEPQSVYNPELLRH